MVYFAAHGLILCSLVCRQVLVEDVELLTLSYRCYIRRFLTVSRSVIGITGSRLAVRTWSGFFLFKESIV